MNLRHIETFVAIADAGSFQAAAERLFLTQSAVSMQIKALEDQLQAELFDRSSRPPVLSALGRSLLERAREIVAQTAAFKQAASGREGLFGALTLGVIPSATTTILPGALARLRDQHPNMAVRVEGDLSTALETLVADGAMDAAIVTEVGRPRTGLVNRVIYAEPLVLAVHRDDADASTEALLDRAPFIRFNRGTGIGRIVDAALQQQGAAVNETMELDSIPAMLMMASRGLGVTVVPQRSFDANRSDALRALPFGAPPVERRVALVTRRGTSKSPLTEALFAALAAEADRTGGVA